MLLSMTGFSSKSASLDLATSGKVAFSIEMKAINGRFFEVVSKLPNILSSLEVKIINLLQNRLLRGRIYITIRFSEERDSFGEITPSMKNIKDYLQVAHDVKQKFHVEGELTLRDIFLLPNVFITNKGQLSEEEEAAILRLIEQTAEELMKTRQEEGATLQKDILKRFSICSTNIEKIKEFAEAMMIALKKEVEEKRVVAEGGDELARMQLEDRYALLNKIDIHEEITRFKSHLNSVDTLLKSDEVEKGKRLDFILQELLRETNTIMAKCSSFDISTVGVDIKVELEKAREQVQNIV